MFSVYVKTTNRCNLKCPHCYISQNDQNISSFDLVGDFIGRIFKDNGKTHVILHGGEPTLYPSKKELSLFVERLKLIGVSVSITTNLAYALDDSLENFFKECPPVTSWNEDRFKTNLEYQMWLKNIKTYRPDVLVTITPKLIDLGIPFLKNQEWVKEVPFILLEPMTGDVGSDYLKNMNEFLSGSVDEKFKFYLCNSIMCSDTVFTINPDLTVSGCPNNYKNTYGSLSDFNTLDQLLKSKKRVREWAKESYFKTLSTERSCYMCGGFYDINSR